MSRPAYAICTRTAGGTHEWKLAGGDTGDLMLLLGWASEEMARHYGASAAAERAREAAIRLSIGDDL